MTDATCSTRDCPDLRSSQQRHSVFNARAVCSMVTSGFSPPQPVGLLGGEQQHQLAQGHVPHQPPVVSALEVGEADLRLGQAEHVLDAGPRERDLQERQQGGPGRGVGGEVLDLAAVDVAGDDQPVRSEEHTSELQSQSNLVCRLLLEKKKKNKKIKETKKAI